LILVWIEVRQLARCGGMARLRWLFTNATAMDMSLWRRFRKGWQDSSLGGH